MVLSQNNHVLSDSVGVALSSLLSALLYNEWTKLVGSKLIKLLLGRDSSSRYREVERHSARGSSQNLYGDLIPEYLQYLQSNLGSWMSGQRKKSNHCIHISGASEALRNKTIVEHDSMCSKQMDRSMSK